MDYDTKGIVKTVEEEIVSIRQGDFKHAYNKLTTKDFKQDTCFDEFLLFLSKIPSLYNNISLRLGMACVNENGGIYEGEISAKEGEKVAIRVDLKRDSARWLIDSMIIYPLRGYELPRAIAR